MIVSENEGRSFDEFYEEYQGMVYKLSLKYSGYDEYLAEDATQHAFIQLYGAMKKETDIANVKSYLHTIVKNYILNSFRKAQRIELQDEVSGIEDSEENLIQSAENAYVEILERQYNKTMLQLILDELKEKNTVWYTVVIEVFHKGRSQADVAKELGMNDTAMYATVRRIRKWSKKHKVRFEECANNNTKEVSDGHLFSVNDEFAHNSSEKCVQSDRQQY